MKKASLLIFFVVIVSAAFGAGFYFAKTRVPVAAPEGIINEELGKPENLDFSLFWEAWTKLEEKYVDNSKIDYKKMLYGAITGMAASFNDDYTVYFPPEDSKIFKENV